MPQTNNIKRYLSDGLYYVATSLTVVVLVVFITFIALALNALVVYLLWPYVIPIIMPGLVSSGSVLGSLTFTQSLLVVLLFDFLTHNILVSLIKGYKAGAKNTCKTSCEC